MSPARPFPCGRVYHTRMTPRGTDWSLGALVALLFTTGALSLISGRDDQAWVFVLHGVGGALLALVTLWKLRRVGRRLLSRRAWEPRMLAGALATGMVALALASGWSWSNGADLFVGGFNLLNWHIVLGVLLTLAVAEHMRVRSRPLRRRDLADRRQMLHLGGIALAALASWWLQRPLARKLGWRGSSRRWTGSYEKGSWQGNAFPATSWVADRPRPLPAGTYRLAIRGMVASPQALALVQLEEVDSMVATLDCTGGFFSTQHWRGSRLDRVLQRAGPLPAATHVRIISRTGYRWSFPLHEARDLLLATHVGDEPISHDHGAPVRLVAPGRRGFQWIKWVVRVELHAGPDAGAAASTLWSSWTPAGRGKF